MNNIFLTKSNEFIYNIDEFFYIGLIDSVIKKMGDIKHISLPNVEEFFSKGEIFGFIESENFACEIFMPVSGIIKEINMEIYNSPNILNKTNIKDSWLIKISASCFLEDKNDLICYNSDSREGD